MNSLTTTKTTNGTNPFDGVPRFASPRFALPTNKDRSSFVILTPTKRYALKLSVLAYLKRDGHTLMLHKARGYQKGKWNGLGGKLEPGESPEQALKREVFEESGLHVEAAQLRGFITFPSFDGEADWYAFVYTVTGFSGELCASDEGELRWVADNEVSALNLWAGDRVFMQWLESPKLFSAVFRYERGEFKGYDVMFY